MASSQSRLFLLAFTLALVGALMSADVRASTIIPMSDEDLTLSSRAIVEGRVTGIEVRMNDEQTAVYTFISFRITRVIKGDLVRNQTIVLKQLGGRSGDNITQFSGLPFFALRWRMMLFLNTDSDGAFHVAHLNLGYFRILRGRGNREYVSRSSFGANVLEGSHPNGRITNYAPRDEFVSRVKNILSDRRDEAARYERERGTVPIRPVPRDFTAAKSRYRVNFAFLSTAIRWTEPDMDKDIKFFVNPEHAPTPSGGVEESEAVASAWSLIPGSSLRVTIGNGTTDACGFRHDGTTAISFGDCLNDIDPPVNCTGVVANGGVSAALSNMTSTVGGEEFYKAIEGDVVFNDGFECLLTNSTIVEEVLTHELGHALGFGHSSTNQAEPNPILVDATMFYLAHNDGRGAAVRQDDEDAARFLYRGEGDGTNLAITTDALPDAPIAAPYEFTLEAKGDGPFTWSIAEGELPAGLTLSEAGVLSGTANAESAAAITFSVRDSANFVHTRALELKVSALPAPFLLTGKYDDAEKKLILTGLNLSADAMVTINDVLIAPPTPVKFKAEKGKLTLEGKAADLNFRKGEPNTASVVVGGKTSNTLSF